MDFWNQFPSPEELSAMVLQDIAPLHVNAHVHTPYSFSAFSSINQAVEMALQENVKVLGINDFYTADGYHDWAEACFRYKLFPLFNIEFIALSKPDQDQNIRINDPSNPGRMYLSGKGLSHPFRLDEPYQRMLREVIERSNMHTQAMCALLNKHLEKVGADMQLSYPSIRERYTLGMVRERHLAKALRADIFEKIQECGRRMEKLEQIFEGKKVKSAMSDQAGLENEIRRNLLKSGGGAFIKESPDLFLSLETVSRMIFNAGGIPTYPLLADSINGGFTEFEEDKERLFHSLVRKGIFSIELIPNRNTRQVLEEYAKFFADRGFLVTFGSEHNTPELLPVRLKDKNREELSEFLTDTNFTGACILVAHQYLFAKTGKGYLLPGGKPLLAKKAEFEALGRRILAFYMA
ncbi:MAG: PHP domain-containing protein [Bacteroidales bacterium]|nr:PHP domain-containing protein [Bacteroidales bacterium]